MNLFESHRRGFRAFTILMERGAKVACVAGRLNPKYSQSIYIHLGFVLGFEVHVRVRVGKREKREIFLLFPTPLSLFAFAPKRNHTESPPKTWTLHKGRFSVSQIRKNAERCITKQNKKDKTLSCPLPLKLPQIPNFNNTIIATRNNKRFISTKRHEEKLTLPNKIWHDTWYLEGGGGWGANDGLHLQNGVWRKHWRRTSPPPSLQTI